MDLIIMLLTGVAITSLYHHYERKDNEAMKFKNVKYNGKRMTRAEFGAINR